MDTICRIKDYIKSSKDTDEWIYRNSEKIKELCGKGKELVVSIS